MVCKSVSEAVSRRILQLCRDKNITVNKLATLSAVTQSTVNDIINMKIKKHRHSDAEKALQRTSDKHYGIF